MYTQETVDKVQSFECDRKLRTKILLIIFAVSVMGALGSWFDTDEQSQEVFYVFVALPIVAFLIYIFAPLRYDVRKESLFFISRFWGGRVKSVPGDTIINAVKWGPFRMLYVASRRKCRVLWPVINTQEFESALRTLCQTEDKYAVPRRNVYRPSVFYKLNLLAFILPIILFSVFIVLMIGSQEAIVPMLIFIGLLTVPIVMIWRNFRIERDELTLKAYSMFGRIVAECELSEGVDFSVIWPYQLAFSLSNTRSSIPIYQIRTAGMYYDLFAISSGHFIFVDYD